MENLPACSVGPEEYHHCKNHADPSEPPKHSAEPHASTRDLILPRSNAPSSNADSATVGIFIAP
jgi:hypothetical protein